MEGDRIRDSAGCRTSDTSEAQIYGTRSHAGGLVGEPATISARFEILMSGRPAYRLAGSPSTVSCGSQQSHRGRYQLRPPTSAKRPETRIGPIESAVATRPGPGADRGPQSLLNGYAVRAWSGCSDRARMTSYD